MSNFFNLTRRMASTNFAVISEHKVKSVPTGETFQLMSLWQDQQALVIFFRRWGCMLCRLWAKELSEITPVLKKNGIRVIGVGVDEEGSKEFFDNKYFDGELFYVADQSTYKELGFKKFSTLGILSSLLWKQSRNALSKGNGMDLGGDLKGDWGQTGGALLMDKEGNCLHHFVQSGPGDHLPNADILKYFGLSNEYKPGTMGNKGLEDRTCTVEGKA